MTKIAFLFPGQGAQQVGMGMDIVARYPQIDALFEQASQITGMDIRKVCFEGPQEQLNATAVSQPAIFTVSAALLELVRTETGIPTPQVTAGLSMGEYSALYAAGLISFEDGLRLVKKRGDAMQAAADAAGGSMVSIMGLDEEKVRQLCRQAAQGELLEPVNFNCPGQIVISGTLDACKRAEQMAADFGAMKAIGLSVAGAFHTEMMRPAADDLAAALTAAPISDPADTRVIANISAEYYESAEAIRDGLIRQLVQPILWHKCIQRLQADGIERFYEIGPQRVLTGLMKRIDRRAAIVNISSAESLQEIINTQ